MTPVLLSLAASCCWGVADFGGGLQSKRVAIPVVLAMVEGTGLVLVLVVIAATGEPQRRQALRGATVAATHASGDHRRSR